MNETKYHRTYNNNALHVPACLTAVAMYTQINRKPNGGGWGTVKLAVGQQHSIAVTVKSDGATKR